MSIDLESNVAYISSYVISTNYCSEKILHMGFDWLDGGATTNWALESILIHIYIFDKFFNKIHSLICEPVAAGNMKKIGHCLMISVHEN